MESKIKRDMITVACISFHSSWGNKEVNLKKIKDYIIQAGNLGANIIIFPELALTGYDDEPDIKMHKQNAETIPGPSTYEILQLARKYNLYCILGMPEKDKDLENIYYNSAAIIGLDGLIGSYRKIHTIFLERKWSKKGGLPQLFFTPWGLIGIGICYDTYMFPELARYYAAMGARLYINITAMFKEQVGWKDYYFNQLRSRSIENMMYIASANLVGKEIYNTYSGNSCIIGPGEMEHVTNFYAGPSNEDNEGLIIATIDLSTTEKIRKEYYPLFEINQKDNDVPDWSMKLYKMMFEQIEKDTNFSKYK